MVGLKQKGPRVPLKVGLYIAEAAWKMAKRGKPILKPRILWSYYMLNNISHIHYYVISYYILLYGTVDGQNPAPVGNYW